MVSHRTANWPLWLAVLTVSLLVGGYAVAWPVAVEFSRAEIPLGRIAYKPPLAEQIQLRAFEVVVACWFFCFGASFGSFLNVVVYRTPRGLSLLGTSFCPNCRHGIRWYDNLPVFGWLRLRGRCRDCQLPIASRYPLVEFAVGMIVLSLAISELFLGGVNLPGGERVWMRSMSWLMARPHPEMIATFAVHAGLLCSLLTWSQIRRDGQPVAAGQIALAVLLGLIVSAAIPTIHPVSWISTRPEVLEACAWCARLDTAVIGGLAGALAGFLQILAAAILRGVRYVADANRLKFVAVNALIGVCLGWQAIVSVLVLTSSLRLVSCLLTGGMRPRHADPAWVHLVWATFIQVIAWRALDQVSGWPGTDQTPISAIVSVAIAVYFTSVAAYAEQR